MSLVCDDFLVLTLIYALHHILALRTQHSKKATATQATWGVTGFITLRLLLA